MSLSLSNESCGCRAPRGGLAGDVGGARGSLWS